MSRVGNGVACMSWVQPIVAGHSVYTPLNRPLLDRPTGRGPIV
jgi:hypothetical protein